jgi:hypothetical protein
MNAPSTAQAPINAAASAPLVEIFQELCETKALLWANYQIELQDAVDQLQTWAVDRGLVAAVGQDAVQEIMAAPFALVRAEPVEAEPTSTDDEVEHDTTNRWQHLADVVSPMLVQWEMADPRDRWRYTGELPPPENVRNGDISGKPAKALQPYHPPKATRQAFWHVVRSADRKALNNWLAHHPADAPFLLKIWKEKNARQAATS